MYRNAARERGEEMEKKKEEKKRRREGIFPFIAIYIYIYIHVHKYTRAHDSFPPFDSSILVYIRVSLKRVPWKAFPFDEVVQACFPVCR